MSKGPKLPKTLYVSRRGIGDGQYYQANESRIEAIDDDGPTRVGTYRLVEEHILTKSVVEKKAP